MKLKTTGYVAKQIQQFYLEILKRYPTQQDLQSYLVLLESGKLHLTDIPILMKNSEEFEIIKNLEKIKQGPIVTKDGFTMYLNPNDYAVSGYLALHKTWEPYETELMKRLFTKKTKFIDIGAHIGYYSLLCASASPDCRIISLEPEPENFQILQKNISANNMKNISAYNIAVSDKTSKADFFIGPSGNSGDNRFFSDDFRVNDQERKKINVECVKLDELLIENMMKPDMIKMDIQGGEMLALKGMTETLNHDQLVLFTEFWPKGILSNGSSPQDFLNLINSKGFEIYELNKEKKILEKKPFEQLIEENLRIDNPLAQTDLLCLKNIRIEN